VQPVFDARATDSMRRAGRVLVVCCAVVWAAFAVQGLRVGASAPRVDYSAPAWHRTARALRLVVAGAPEVWSNLPEGVWIATGGRVSTSPERILKFDPRSPQRQRADFRALVASHRGNDVLVWFHGGPASGYVPSHGQLVPPAQLAADARLVPLARGDGWQAWRLQARS
jgi:hypothetical protein